MSAIYSNCTSITLALYLYDWLYYLYCKVDCTYTVSHKVDADILIIVEPSQGSAYDIGFLYKICFKLLGKKSCAFSLTHLVTKSIEAYFFLAQRRH